MSDRMNFRSSDFDRIDGIWWGAAFVWAALVVFAANTDWAKPNWWDNWGVIFVGAGALAFGCAAIRLYMPEYRSKLLFGAVFGLLLHGRHHLRVNKTRRNGGRADTVTCSL